MFWGAKLSGIRPNTNWAPRNSSREDYARASAVFFVGFSNSDFYLAEHLYSASSSKDKVFFINSKSSTGTGSSWQSKGLLARVFRSEKNTLQKRLKRLCAPKQRRNSVYTAMLREDYPKSLQIERVFLNKKPS